MFVQILEVEQIFTIEQQTLLQITLGTAGWKKLQQKILKETSQQAVASSVYICHMDWYFVIYCNDMSKHFEAAITEKFRQWQTTSCYWPLVVKREMQSWAGV